MKLSLRIPLMIWPFVFGCLLALLVVRCDRAFFPVVKEFTVNEVIKTDKKVSFSGMMNKVRACEFVGVHVDSGPDFALGIGFDDDISRATNTRPLGVQQWGPWHVDLAPQDHVPYLRLIAIHKCFPFGMTSTELTKIALE